MRACTHVLTIEPAGWVLVTVNDTLHPEVVHQVRVRQMDYDRWETGELAVQNAFPYLSPDQREILMTGYGPDSWRELFPPEGEDS